MPIANYACSAYVHTPTFRKTMLRRLYSTTHCQPVLYNLPNRGLRCAGQAAFPPSSQTKYVLARKSS
jgi:hypothetical protein